MTQQRQPMRSVEERNAIVIQYLPLVRHVVRRFGYRKFLQGLGNRDDMVQVGVFGLIRAAELYDVNNPKGTSFKTYAFKGIMKSLFYAGYGSGLIRVPAEQARKSMRGEITSCTPWVVQSTRLRRLRMDRATEDGSVDPIEVADWTTARKQTDIRHSTADVLDELIDELKPADRRLLADFYGLRGRRRRDCAWLAGKRGVTKQCVSKRICIIRDRLCDRFVELGWPDPRKED